jgi:hypothetical protein
LTSHEDENRTIDLSTYQRYAMESDQLGDGEHAVSTFLHNLSDAVTSLSRLYTERRHEDADHAIQAMRQESIEERLGDVLWYVAAISGRLSVPLEDVARRNMTKTRNEWGVRPDDDTLFDANAPPDEQLPRRMTFKFREVTDGDRKVVILSTPLREGGDMQLGDRITDNDYGDDGYRYHDCLHLAYAAILGWSPVIRALLKRKRKTDKKVDEVEDGARANLVEEALTAYIREHAKREKLFARTVRLDYPIFREIKTQVKRLEVRARSFTLWERAILEGYRVYRQLRQDGGGIVTIDLASRQIDCQRLLDS